MPAAVADFTIEQGATWEQEVWWENADGTPKDLTGYAARMQARGKLDDPGTLVDLTTENGGITIDGAAGKITLFMSDAETAALDWPAGQYVQQSGIYQLELVNAAGDGFVTRLLRGTLTLDPEVVHP